MSRAPRSHAARRNWGTDDSQTPILHVDMDAFFASVEVLHAPHLAGRPLIVGGTGARGVVSAASYEARQFGVNSAMPMSMARRLCPQAVVLPVRHGLYSQVSRQVMEILREVTPQVEQLSIDEAFLDVAGARLRMGTPVNIGQWIREQVRCRVGVPASVGIASTKFVAKLASAHAKPDGLLLIPDEVTQTFLGTLPVGAMWGVGERTAEVLKRWGIERVDQLVELPLPQLEKLVGRAAGRRLYDLSRGIDPRPVTSVREEKSMGSETTFERDVFDRDHAARVLLDQTHQCASRLRAHKLMCRVVSIKARGADFTTVTRSRTLAAPSDLAQDLWAVVKDLFDSLPTPAGGFRLLGTRVERLVDANEGIQLLLDEDPRAGAAERAADSVRERWGKTAVRPASLFHGET